MSGMHWRVASVAEQTEFDDAFKHIKLEPVGAIIKLDGDEVPGAGGKTVRHNYRVVLESPEETKFMVMHHAVASLHYFKLLEMEVMRPITNRTEFLSAFVFTMKTGHPPSLANVCGPAQFRLIHLQLLRFFIDNWRRLDDAPVAYQGLIEPTFRMKMEARERRWNL